MKLQTLNLDSDLLPMWEALQRATTNTNTLTLFNSPVYSTDVPFVGAAIIWDGIQNLSYTYDAVGNVLTIRDTSATVSGRTESFTYDDLYRLTTALTTLATSTPYSDTYTYDALGNITNKTGIGAYLYQGNTGTNWANPHAPTSIASSTVSYDKDGNLTNYASTTNAWDYKNRLTWVYASSSPSTFQLYDHTMQRIAIYDGTSTSTRPNKYYSIATSTASTIKHIYTPDGELVATIKGSGATTSREYLHLDQLGSVAAITNSAGTTTSATSYYPYGTERVTTGNRDQRGYISGERNATNDYYLINRSLNTDRGQFTSEDPVFWEIGLTQDGKQILLDPQSANSYSYSSDNPINKKDPTGRAGEAFIARMILGGSLLGPEGTLAALALSALATYAVMPQTGKLIETVQPPNFAELGFPRSAPDPGDLQPPRGGGPQWQKFLYFGLGAGAAAYLTNDAYNQFKGDINNLLRNVFGPRNNPNLNNGTSYNAAPQYTVQGNSTYIRTSGGGLAPTPLPATVKNSQGTTYYRNSSGLLSTKPGQ